MESIIGNDGSEKHEKLENTYTLYFGRDKEWSADVELLEEIGRGNFSSAHKALVRGPSGVPRDMVIKRVLPELYADYFPSYEQFLVEMGPYCQTYEECTDLNRGMKRNEILWKEAYGYHLAKSAGLKVFPYCALGERDDEEVELVVSSGFTENVICLGDKGENSRLDHFGIPTMEGIDNMSTFAYSIFDQGVKASRCGLQLDADTFFFLFDKIKPSEIDFVLGDLGNIEVANMGLVESEDGLFGDNVKGITRAVTNFVNRNFVEGQRSKIIKELLDLFGVYKKKYSYEFDKSRV